MQDIVRLISSKNERGPDWMTAMAPGAPCPLAQGWKEPDWAMVDLPADRFPGRSIYYAPSGKAWPEKPKSLDDVDPKLLPPMKSWASRLKEQMILAGVRRGGKRARRGAQGRVDAVFDSVPGVGTILPGELKTGRGCIFWARFSEAIRLTLPELVRKYLGIGRAPVSDNFLCHALTQRRCVSDGPLSSMSRRVRCAAPIGAVDPIVPDQC